jgi:hypothetical protein
MEAISRGPVSLLYFTVQLDDFANLHPHPPYRYFLVTQVFTPDGEYICTQLLGIDLRAAKYLEAQGCDRRTADKLTAAHRETQFKRAWISIRFVVTKATDAVLEHVVGTGQKIQ